jgi:hypothetical protein
MIIHGCRASRILEGRLVISDSPAHEAHSTCIRGQPTKSGWSAHTFIHTSSTLHACTLLLTRTWIINCIIVWLASADFAYFFLHTCIYMLPLPGERERESTCSVCVYIFLILWYHKFHLCIKSNQGLNSRLVISARIFLDLFQDLIGAIFSGRHVAVDQTQVVWCGWKKYIFDWRFRCNEHTKEDKGLCTCVTTVLKG